jgi:hypothetical protein
MPLTLTAIPAMYTHERRDRRKQCLISHRLLLTLYFWYNIVLDSWNGNSLDCVPFCKEI